VAVAVAAIMVTQLAGYQELVLVLVLMVLSTIIMEVIAVLLALLAMLCCHHNNTHPRLVVFSLYDTPVIAFSYSFAYLELPCHSVFQ
jgi:hypothetical protein